MRQRKHGPRGREGRIRARLAWLFVGAGSALLAYPLISYRIASVEQQRLLAEARRMPVAARAAAAHPASETTVRPAVAAPAPAGSTPILRAIRPKEGTLLGTVSIPRIGLETAVLEGVSDATLMAAPGHVPGTARLGQDGVSVIAAHRDLQFRELWQLVPGDRINVRLPSGIHRYRVTKLVIADPSESWIIDTGPSRPTALRLVTCWPMNFVGPAPDRLVASAVPIDPSAPPVVPADPVRTLVLRAATVPGTSVPLTSVGTLGATVGALALFAATRGARTKRTFAAWVAGLGLAALAIVAAGVVPVTRLG